MIALLPLLPAVLGVATWASDALPSRRRPPPSALGVAATVGMLLTAAIAALVVTRDSTAVAALGAGLQVELALDPTARVMALLVPLVAAPVVGYAAVHEEGAGLPRLLGMLQLFVAAMLLLVAAADLLLLLVGWELVAAASWGLIGWEWRDASRPARAAHAFHATRAGTLGLFVAAGALFADTGSLAFSSVPDAGAGTLGVVAAGVVLAAVSKSGQVPFAPWLTSAMAGPTPASALLHSATMVAAGAFALARLEPLLAPIGWFGPVLIGIGLTTALAGGIVAAVRADAKEVLAASTSAQYGLMLVAIGAGHPAIAMLHLVVHAVFKSQLFLSTGIAIEAVGSRSLGRMRLGGHLPLAAWVAGIGAAALAAVPPLGAGWTKEEVVAAGAASGTVVAVLVAVAGGLSAYYATRLQLLAWGGDGSGPRQLVRRPRRSEHAATIALAAAGLLAGLLWVPSLGERAITALGGEPPTGHAWQVVLSLTLLALGGYGAWVVQQRGRIATVASTDVGHVADRWFGLRDLARVAVADPLHRSSAALARFDDRIVDRGVQLAAAAAEGASRVLRRTAEVRVDAVVEAVARATTGLATIGAGLAERGVDAVVGGVAVLVERAGDDARRVQTGLVHHQFTVIAIGLAVAVAAALVGR